MLRRIAFLLLLLFVGLSACADVLVGRQFTAEPNDMERLILADGGDIQLVDLTTNGAGQIAVLGDFTGTLDLGDGAPIPAEGAGRNLFLVVLEADGSPVYKVVYQSDGGTLKGWELADSGAGFSLTGHFNGDLFREGERLASGRAQSTLRIEHDATGAVVRLASVASESGFANVQGKGLDYAGTRRLECGNYLNRADFGGGFFPDAGNTGDNGYIQVFDSDTPAWSDVVISSPEPDIQGVLIDDCDFFATGAILGGHFDGQAAFASYTADSAGEFDGLVIAYTADGEVQWNQVLAGPGRQQVQQVDASLTAVFASGRTSGEFTVDGFSLVGENDRDGYVLSFTPDGAPRWGFRVTSAGNDGVSSIDADGEGVLIAGHFSGTLPAATGGRGTRGDADGFVMALDGSGEPRWARKFGTTGFDRCEARAGARDVITACSLGAEYVLADGERAAAGSLLVARFTP